MTPEQSYSAEKKVTDGVWVIKHGQLHFVSSQKTRKEKCERVLSSGAVQAISKDALK